MKYSVVTIARTLSAGGEAIARKLATEFGMRYVDEEIIDRAAARAGVTADEMARAEMRKGLIERIFESFAPAGAGSGAPATEALTGQPGYEQLIVDVLRQTAAAGNAVIVAHGAAIALAESPGTLRVLVTASASTRAARLVAEGKSESAAQKLVEDSDRSRADFFRRFYKLEYEEPTHYDLVVNTDHLGVAAAAALIRDIIRPR
jgi:cytidylate kinase